MSVLNDCTYRAQDYLGCHQEGDSTVFRVWAPNAQAVSIVGDFNGWDPSDAPMVRDWEGYWTGELTGLGSGQLYKYAVTGPDGRQVLKADPFAFHAETGPGTASKIWNLNGYNWEDSRWMQTRPTKNLRSLPMNIYEMHIGSWRLKEGETFPNYKNIAPELAEYCRKMGYTHIELLPITEFPFVGSWGYQVTGYFAPTSRYGTPQDFMAFVDILHQAGIGVIIDWVAAHFPRDEHGLARFDGTPLFEYADPRMGEHAEWGTLVFDYASPDVRGFLISSALFFLERYHVDGLRCDAVSSMLYLDYGRKAGEWVPNKDGGNINYDVISFWQQFNTAIQDRCPGTFTVAEESTAFPHVTGPVSENGLGFTFKWDMGFMHDTLDYFKLDPYFRQYNHDKITFSMMYAFSEYYILAYSHDEVVHGKCSMVQKMSGLYDDKFATLRALYGYQFAHPGKKLNFMGGEFGQFIEWNYQQSLDWMLLDYPKHQGMQQFCGELGQLYLSQPALWQIEDSWDGFTWLNPDDRDRSSIAFIRWPAEKKKAKPIVCVCNFTPVFYPDFVIGLPADGTLTSLLNSDDTRFGGNGMRLPSIQYEDKGFREFTHRAHLPLPPLSVQYFTFTEKKTAKRKPEVNKERKNAS